MKMTKKCYIGFDLGTSGLRGLIVDEGGATIASHEVSYASQRPERGWSEQDPANWIAACGAVVQQLRAQVPDEWACVAGIGVSGHMHGAVLLDRGGAVVRPCMLWNDTRSHIEAASLDGVDRVREVSGNIVFPGFTAPKLMWVATHEPENFSKTAKVLLPAAYLNFWLTGAYVADMSDSAGTSWLDVGARNWSQELLDASGMTRSQMPDLVEGSHVAAALRADLARDWGLSPAVQVAGGAGDNAAAACGAGVLKEGQGFISLGTSGVLLAARDSYAPNAASAVHTFCHAVPDRWYQMGVILAATDCLNWLASVTGQTPAALTSALGDTLTAPSDLKFMPYLSGDRTPHNDSQIRGSFIGLDIGTTTKDMTHAVLAGVAYALRDSYEALKTTGVELHEVLALGGGTKSRLWVEMVATVLNLPLAVPADGDFGAALGAARLAQCAVTGADPATVMTAPDIDEIIQPNPALIAAYDAGYIQYKRLYPAMKALL
ncbi:xylulokinase [uncultured Sulfitobacter sp.]|uniref:xylulokinase n=1 Tax=uncultured Sulfitobacter sp. TaxID=191468 RepID=UPI002618296D|nr:xylulokinase [uncultured Sulfitobacter sp.]